MYNEKSNKIRWIAVITAFVLILAGVITSLAIAIQNKPVYFYAFDLERYEKERAFYFDYESYVPGPVAKDFQTLLNLLNSNVSETYRLRRNDFNYANFGTPDGKAAERIVDKIIYDK